MIKNLYILGGGTVFGETTTAPPLRPRYSRKILSVSSGRISHRGRAWHRHLLLLTSLGSLQKISLHGHNKSVRFCVGSFQLMYPFGIPVKQTTRKQKHWKTKHDSSCLPFILSHWFINVAWSSVLFFKCAQSTSLKHLTNFPFHLKHWPIYSVPDFEIGLPFLNLEFPVAAFFTFVNNTRTS